MSTSRKRGFATLSPAQLKAVSRKGGQAKVSKGLAKLSPGEVTSIAQRGAAARWAHKKGKENNGKDSIPSGDGSSDS